MVPKFDSNEDTAFHHVTPTHFVLVRGQVISGWHVGFALLKVGSDLLWYIPSGMAYGAQSRPVESQSQRHSCKFDIGVDVHV